MRRGRPVPPELRVLFTGEGIPSEEGLHGTGNTFAPKVLRENGTWRMWYGAQGGDGHDRIHYAESADGLRWERRGVVLEHPESNLINDPWVMPQEGGYRMYYTVAEEWIVDTIHLAESTDGLTWERRGEALGPGPEGAFDSLLVGRPCVWRVGSTWHMWYDGRRDFPPFLAQEGKWPSSPASERWVGHATSDDGLTWQREPGPALDQPAGSVHVAPLGERWLMLLETRQGTGLMASSDLRQWEHRGFLRGLSGGPWDPFGHITPYLVDVGEDVLRVYAGLARRASWTEQAMGAYDVTKGEVEELVRASAS